MKLRIALTMLTLSIVTQRAPAKTFAYVSLSADNAIEVYELRDTGDLTLLDTVRTPGDPGGLAVHPSKKFLVAAMRDAGKLVSFSIDAEGGTLLKVNEVRVDVDPAYIEYDKTGRHLMTAYYVTGKAAIHDIGPGGMIATEGEFYRTAKNAHAIVTDKTNQWAFVPHTGPNSIYQFAFNERSGKLSANKKAPKLQFAENTGPRHFSIHPNNRYGFCDNEQGSSVTAMNFDADNGTLTAMQTLPTIPSDFREPNTCARMMLHPNGEFLYASNRGHDSIAAFRIDQSSGKLSPIGVFPSEKTPRGFHISPSGKFLIAAGESSNRLAIYEIASNGSLKRIGSCNTGNKPWWVTMVSFQVTNRSD